MTYEQFVFWLKGYIEGNTDGHVYLEPIKKALDSVSNPVGFQPLEQSQFYCYKCFQFYTGVHIC